MSNNRRIMTPDGSQPSGAMSGGGILVYAQPIFNYYGKTDLDLGEGSTLDPGQTLVVSYNLVNDPHGVNATGLTFSGGPNFRIRGGIITENVVVGGRARGYLLAGTGPANGTWGPPFTFFTSNVMQKGIVGEVNASTDNFAFCHSAASPVAFLSTSVATFHPAPNASCTGEDTWAGGCPNTTVGYLYGTPMSVMPTNTSLMGWHDEGDCSAL